MLPFEDGAFVETECCNCFAVPKVNTRRQEQMNTISFNNKVSTPREKMLQDLKHKETNGNDSIDSDNADTVTPNIPLPPSLEIKAGSEISILDIQKNLKNLYDYNMMLREKLVITQSAIHALTSKASSSSSSSNQRQQ